MQQPFPTPQTYAPPRIVHRGKLKQFAGSPPPTDPFCELNPLHPKCN